MSASSTTETMARTICRKIRAKHDLFPSGCAEGQEVLDVQSGLALAIERRWLARRTNEYVLTDEGREVAHRSGSGAVDIKSVGFGMR